jgi:putative transposase
MMVNEPAPELEYVSDAEWQTARQWLALLRELAHKQDRTRAEVAAVAAAMGRGVSQTYSLLRRYEADPKLTSLLHRQKGPARGYTRLSPTLERLIEETIDGFYLTRQKVRLCDLVVEIGRHCHARGIRKPSRKAIAARVRARPKFDVLARREGTKVARERFGSATGSLTVDRPLGLVQIDHTLVDVIVVDSVTRAPIQRPWLTLAIDVCTRCVAGFHLSLEPPSATSVALCVSHAVLSKEPWLAARNIAHAWPVHGLFQRLHLDNAKEFRSEALRRGCEQYGIEIDYRPVRTPHFGGHIERLIGTMMGKVHLLPGTTYSNITEKGDLDPEKSAAMTLDEVERWLGEAIAGVYHQVEHRSLGFPPLTAWSRAAAEAPAAQEITDPKRFLIDFLPLERRLIRREGVSLHSIHYWSDVLTSWIGEKEKLIVRYDPRDLSRVYLRAPNGEYLDLSYRDVRRPPISLWEHRLATRKLREEGRAHVDENAIFQAVEAMRRIADEAVQMTKAVRRQQERRARLIRGGLTDDTAPLPAGDPSPQAADGIELQPWENMLPVEEWE